MSETEKELLDSLADMVGQHCYRTDTDNYTSGAISTDADAMRLLVKHGRFKIEKEFGRIVIGDFINGGS